MKSRLFLYRLFLRCLCLLTAILSGTFMPLASEANAEMQAATATLCQGPTIASIPRPIDPNHHGRGEFNYKYLVLHSSSGGSRATVIFLPGGPGETSMDPAFRVDARANLGIPDDFDLVLTDPRGVGCNEGLIGGRVSPADFFTTPVLASDIVEIIRRMRANGAPVVLYGVSYGTVLATHAAHQAQKVLGQAPAAVVMDGVVGRAYRGIEMTDNVLKVVSDFVFSLSPASQQTLANNTAPMGIPGQQWFNLIRGALYTGTDSNPTAGTETETDAMKTLFEGLLTPEAGERNEMLDGVSRAGAPSYASTPSATGVMFRYIGCREIFPPAQAPSQTYGLERLKVFGFAQSTEARSQDSAGGCTGLSLSQPFDAADMQLATPLYYFSRTHDIGTPLWQAQYHYEQQKQAPLKQLVRADGRGHADVLLRYVDSSRTKAGETKAGCRNEIWSAIIEGQDIRPALASCQGFFEVQSEVQSEVQTALE